MTEAQIKVVNWLYNFTAKVMEQTPDVFQESELLKLQESVKEAFPTNHEDILKNL